MARRSKEETAAEFAPESVSRPNAKAFAEIAAKSKSFRPAREVLRRVRAVPTIFPHVDWKLRVGGWPIDRIAMIHGESGFGKTTFLHGLGLSFLRRGHIYAPIDAEHTTPAPWLEELLGSYVDDPRLIASRPESYEQAVDDVERIAEGVAEARKKGDIPPETTCLFGVDSIGKLTPQNILERMKKHAAEHEKGSIDGFSGAAGMIRAAMNKAWLDRLVPLMSRTGCAIAFIAREAKDKNATADDRKYGRDWVTTGGASLYYDASLDIRIAHAKMIHESEGTEGYKSPVVGELHVVEIHKTKVSAREREVETSWFSTSNGRLTPPGFDRARDLMMLGLQLEVIALRGSWLSFGGHRWQGKNKFLEK